ncbi:MAG TPA: glycosyltransferase family 4 protein [Actinomycetota bacterium]|jgi:glycosyltransferase involved in cell wall biosynthesis
MRVTVVTARFPPMRGGVADHTLAWCRALVELGGFDLAVVTSPGASQGANTGDIPVDASQTDWSRAGAAALRSAVERSKPDVVVIQYVPHAFSRRGGGLPFARVLRGLSRSLGVPLVVCGHELYAPWSEGWHRAPWSLAQRVGVGVLAASSRALVVTVKARQERVQAALPRWRDRILVVPNGPTVLPVAPNPRWRAEHGVGDGLVVLATLGLRHPAKDTAALEAALTQLEASDIDARLFVAGGLVVRHPWAIDLGYVDAAAAGQLLAAADLFVLPLADGASGRRSSLISALAAGAAVVSTAGSDTDPALFPAGALSLTPAGDTGAFASAVERLAADPGARMALREGGRALFEQEFAWPVVARRWSDILHNAAS